MRGPVRAGDRYAVRSGEICRHRLGSVAEDPGLTKLANGIVREWRRGWTARANVRRCSWESCGAHIVEVYVWTPMEGSTVGHAVEVHPREWSREAAETAARMAVDQSMREHEAAEVMRATLRGNVLCLACRVESPQGEPHVCEAGS